MEAASKTAAHDKLIDDFATGANYATASKTVTVKVWDKLKAIVSLYNAKHPDAKVYLVESGDPVAKTDSTSGGVAYAAPFASHGFFDNGNPLTPTLWIVLSCGLAGLLAIGIAGLLGRRKEK